MSMTFNPAVCGRHRLGIVAGLFALAASAGCVVSVLAVVGVLRLLESVAGQEALWAVALAAIILGAARDLDGRVFVPYRQRQVPEHARQFLRPTTLSIVFGFLLGLGFWTRFTYGAHLAVMVTVGAFATPGVALGAAAAIGIAKTVPILATADRGSLADASCTLNTSHRGEAAARFASMILCVAAAGFVIRHGIL